MAILHEYDSRGNDTAADNELKRIYAYLEPHVAPRDINTVRWAFQLPLMTEKDARQIEMAVTED